jgi:hypothetical protein
MLRTCVYLSMTLFLCWIPGQARNDEKGDTVMLDLIQYPGYSRKMVVCRRYWNKYKFIAKRVLTMCRQNNIENIKDRRSRVDELLRKGTDKKLLAGNTELARKNITEAYRIASSPPAIDPWRAVAAYRLAHLLLRSSREREGLEEIDKLFAVASRAGCLGPLPSIYRLAVLSRLKAFLSQAEFEYSKERLFFKAVENVQSMSPPGDYKESPWLYGPLQDSCFNMLELSSYFLDINYQRLEGQGGDPYFDISRDSSSWIMVGPHRELARVRYPESFAFAELDSWCGLFPEAVFFRISKDETHNHWKYAGSEWQATRHKGLLLLAHMLLRKIETKVELKRHVVGHCTNDHFRQVKSRLKQDLAGLINKSSSGIMIDDSVSGLPVVSGDIMIFGAVEEKVLQRR